MTVKFPLFVPRLAIAAVAAAAFSLPLAAAQDHPGDGPHGAGMMAAQSPGGHGPMVGAARVQSEIAPAQDGGGVESRRERRQRYLRERRMEILDADRDGNLALPEITGEQKRLFNAADVDGDGKLSAEEFRRRGRWFVRLGTMTFFDMLDANGDGQITAEEITGPSERWFKRNDANGNGILEPDELARSRQRSSLPQDRR